MSNHIGNANKMVGEDHIRDATKMVRECVSNEQVTGEATPNEELRRQILSPCVAKNEREWWAARTIEMLEFELNAANESFRKLNIHTLNLVDRIRRLEEAGDRMEKLMPDGSICDKAANAWREAKEAKP